MKNKPCTFEYLASTEFGQIMFCRECQMVHLHLQNLTLRISVHSFIGITNTLAEATAKLRAITQKKPKRPNLTIVKQ